MLLTTKNQSLQIDLDGAVSANELQYHVEYVDRSKSGKTENPRSVNGVTTGATAATMLTAPQNQWGGEFVRDIKGVQVYNKDTAAAAVTIQILDGSTAYVQIKVTLQAGETLVFTQDRGWEVLTTTGALKANTTAQVSGQLVVVNQDISVTDFTDGGTTAGTLALAAAMAIPAGARFLYCLISNIIGFAGDTSAVITVGDGTDADRYNTGTPNVFATAADGVDMGVPSGTAFHAAAKTVTATVTTAADFTACKTDASGRARITLAYLAPV